MKCVPSFSQPDCGPVPTLLMLTCKWTLLINGSLVLCLSSLLSPSLASSQYGNYSELFAQNSQTLCLQDVKICSAPEPQRKGNCSRAGPSLHWQQLFCIWALIHNQTLMNHAILLKSTVLKSTT